MTTAVVVEDLGKKFRLYRDRNATIKTAVLHRGRAAYDEFWALRGVSFDVPQGSTFGLIGSNGSGKSTLLRCLARILRADEGRGQVVGRVAALLELGSGFHHELTGRQNVFLNGTILGMKRRELARRFDDIVAFAGLESAIDQPVKNYSSGMYARLGFAVATSVDPEVLLVDEVLAVGDVAFQRRCMERIRELRSDGRTVVVVSHDAAAVRNMCDSAAWLAGGSLQRTGDVDVVLDAYLRSMAEDRRDVVGDSERWGNGDVLLTEVMLVDEEAQPIGSVETRAPVSVRLRWLANAPVNELVIGVEISSSDGTHVWGANTAGPRIHLKVLAASGCVILRVPTLSLLPGQYWIDAAAQDRTGAHVYDYRRRVIQMSVVGADYGGETGHLSLAPEWHVNSDLT